tara:strand:+ start:7744 stop:7971 length:228 start_codon:yes stop_codon:yes gene_type:complete
MVASRKTHSKEIPSTKKGTLVDIERRLDIATCQRTSYGGRSVILDHKAKVDAVNDHIILLQTQYKKLTGGFYTPK